ncbi:MAG: hypothetical protein ACOZIN_12585 [Myxococcota bacterium]
MTSHRWWRAAVLVVAAGCSDSVDQAAKARIFSPESPPPAVTSAAERLPPEEVAAHPRIARRILGMGAAEATERIGPHHYQATVTFEWTGNARTVRLVETRTLRAGPGGVNGDFHGVIENSREQGLEVLRVHGEVFAKSRHGKFRQRRRDRGIAEREREEIFGAVKEIDALFRGRLALAPSGTVTHEGRTAWRYTVSLGPPMAGSSEEVLPPPTYPKGEADPTTRLRLAFFDQREPRSLQGEVLVDAQTSVVLKARLDGRLAVSSDGGDAHLHLKLDAVMTDVGKDPGLSRPKEPLPDQDKPVGITEALDRFGFPRGGRTDAGAPASSSEAAPPDDE